MVSRNPKVSAVSHTASLAGSDKGAAANEKAWVTGGSLSEFIETLKIFHCNGRLSGPSVASVSCSGGEASLIADISNAKPISFPKLTKTQKRTLRLH